MRHLLALFLFLGTISAIAQNAIVGVDAFEVENPALRNGKIYYFNPANDTTYNFRVAFGLNTSAIGSNSIDVEAYAVFENSGTEYLASDKISLTKASFVALSGTSTGFLNKTFTLQGNKKDGKLSFKYRFKSSLSGYNDWSNWLYSSKTYDSQRYTPSIPAPTITGSYVICSEETYTITNAMTVSLENASGIATLTNLGGDQYKITRIGGLSGSVTLKATNSNLVSITKMIAIGAYISGTTIGGMPNWEFGDYSEVDYDIVLPEGITDINWTVSGHSKVIATKINNNTVRLSTNGAIPFRTNVNLTLRAYGVNSCGNTINYISKTIPFTYLIP